MNKKLPTGFDTTELKNNYHCSIANVDSGAVALNIEFNCLPRFCKITKSGI